MNGGYHHGNLRAVLLDQAVDMLRTAGVEGLSLRELARQAGVSHGAPRSHFADRQALLDALAELGFVTLTARLQTAIDSRGSVAERFRRVGHAYIDFAVEEALLMDLMFAAKLAGTSPDVDRAAGRMFALLDSGLTSPKPNSEDARGRFKMLFAATMHGTSSLIAAGRVPVAQQAQLIDDAITTLLDSAVGRLTLGPGS